MHSNEKCCSMLSECKQAMIFVVFLKLDHKFKQSATLWKSHTIKSCVQKTSNRTLKKPTLHKKLVSIIAKVNMWVSVPFAPHSRGVSNVHLKPEPYIRWMRKSFLKLFIFWTECSCFESLLFFSTRNSSQS